MSSSQHLLNRIRGEYLEMPGLRLTPAQAARLWALDLDRAGALLSALVDAGFLVRAGDGQYARRGDSEGVRTSGPEPGLYGQAEPYERQDLPSPPP